MQLPHVIFGTLIERYKRFLVDVELEDGTVITAHCPNTGRMTTCTQPGWRVALSDSRNPQRKHRYTWELVHNGTCWICVNTGRANELAYEALSKGIIPELAGYTEVLREQTFGRSRFDLLLRQPGVACASRLRERATGSPPGGEADPAPSCYIEVKNVTLLADDGCYAFPDAVTERGRKHLRELIDVVHAGHRAAMLYVIARSGGGAFRAAREIDPAYAAALDAALAAGVEVYAWQASVSPAALFLSHPVHFRPGCWTGLFCG
jgi:sugar fermentation stimulation protein A